MKVKAITDNKFEMTSGRNRKLKLKNKKKKKHALLNVSTKNKRTSFHSSLLVLNFYTTKTMNWYKMRRKAAIERLKQQKQNKKKRRHNERGKKIYNTCRIKNITQ